MLCAIKKNSTLAETAYDVICKAILNGTLPLGTKVSEVFLAEQLGISRTSVRPAMHKLFDDGLLIQISERIIKTFEINKQTTYNIYQSRAVLESGLALSIPESELKDLSTALSTLVEKMDLAIEEKDLPLFNALDSQFHSTAIDMFGTDDIKKSWKSLVLKIDIVRNATQISWDSVSKSQNEHKEIVRLINNNDYFAMALALRKHAYNQQEYLYLDGV